MRQRKMMIRINDINDPQLNIFRNTSENQLYHYYEPALGLFMAESLKVLSRAIDAGYEPECALIEDKVLDEVLPVLKDFDADKFNNDALYELLVEFAASHELKNGTVLWPIRTALSGKQMTPGGATELMSILGKEESLARIDAAIAKLS